MDSQPFPIRPGSGTDIFQGPDATLQDGIAGNPSPPKPEPNPVSYACPCAAWPRSCKEKRPPSTATRHGSHCRNYLYVER